MFIKSMIMRQLTHREKIRDVLFLFKKETFSSILFFVRLLLYLILDFMWQRMKDYGVKNFRYDNQWNSKN